jgi:hypothetical protein
MQFKIGECLDIRLQIEVEEGDWHPQQSILDGANIIDYQLWRVPAPERMMTTTGEEAGPLFG